MQSGFRFATFKSRVKKLMKYYDLKASQFRTKFNISKEEWDNYMKHEYTPTDKDINKFLSSNINPEWLKTGYGIIAFGGSEDEDITGICSRFKEIRLGRSLTQSEFADALDVSRINVVQIENYRHAPTIKLARKLKKKFNISYNWLIDGKVAETDKDHQLFEKLKHDNDMLKITNELLLRELAEYKKRG